MKSRWTERTWKRAVLLLSLTALLIICILILIFAKNSEIKIRETAGYAMGTSVYQTVYCEEDNQAPEAASQAIIALENKISWKIEGSDIYRVNENAGKGFTPLSEETRVLLSQTLEIAENCDGALDPTVLPLSSLWNFDGDGRTVPSEDKISSFLPYVNYKSLFLSDKGAYLEENGMGIDLDAISMGAACDEAIKIYESYGVKGAVIAVGGSIGIYGEKPDGIPWRIALRDPNGAVEDTLGELSLTDGFVSTSGSYENCFIENGITYHHILDPRTGYPAQSGLVSVAVVHENGAVSDALSTACFILGIEESRGLLEKMGAGAVFVDEKDQVTVVGNLDFTLKNENYVLVS